MTLGQLKQRASAIKIAGRILPDKDGMDALQRMIFDQIIALCDPLNLSIPYEDRDIARVVSRDVCESPWYLRMPRIAQRDDEYIDIDKRLEDAFVYFTVSVVAADAERVYFEQKAERSCVEYACYVERTGLSRAKELYEHDTFIDGVRFDCFGRTYSVKRDFVEAVIGCACPDGVCVKREYERFVALYRDYIANNGSIDPVYLERMRAVDRAVFVYLLDHPRRLKDIRDHLCEVTTLFRAFDDMDSTEGWQNIVNQRLSIQGVRIDG